MNLLLGENLGEIRGRILARFWPPRLLLPGENHGENRGKIVPRFWPLGISLPSENLAGISARFPPRRKVPAAKISPGSQQDSRRDRGGIPPRSRSLFYKGANQVTLKMQETERTVYSQHPRRLESFCRYNYKGSTFSSVNRHKKTDDSRLSYIKQFKTGADPGFS